MYWLTSILGLALILAPFALGYNTNPTAMWSSIILGAIVALASGYKAITADRHVWEDVVDVVVGVVAIAIPFALGFNVITAALWTFVVLGVLTILLSGYNFYMARRGAA